MMYCVCFGNFTICLSMFFFKLTLLNTVIVGKLVVTQRLRKFIPFMVMEDLLLSSQDLFTEPYPEPF